MEACISDDSLRSRVMKLEDLVDYQGGSVVSRTIIQGEKGTVTLFAFDEGQFLSEHSAPFDVLVQILEGKMEIKIGGKPYEVSGGESLIMPADIPHALKALTRAKMNLVMIRS
jgi:quercetin dioxygenase-like cupin family protein